jgi:hypothetical protein
MKRISGRRLAVYVVLCLAGVLMVWYGSAEFFSTPVTTIIYHPKAVVSPATEEMVGPMPPGLAAILLLLMVAAGVLIAWIWRTVPPMVTKWLIQREGDDADL